MKRSNKETEDIEERINAWNRQMYGERKTINDYEEPEFICEMCFNETKELDLVLVDRDFIPDQFLNGVPGDEAQVCPPCKEKTYDE